MKNPLNHTTWSWISGVSCAPYNPGSSEDLYVHEWQVGVDKREEARTGGVVVVSAGMGEEESRTTRRVESSRGGDSATTIWFHSSGKQDKEVHECEQRHDIARGACGAETISADVPEPATCDSRKCATRSTTCITTPGKECSVYALPS